VADDLKTALGKEWGCNLISIVFLVFIIGYGIYWFASGGEPQNKKFFDDCYRRETRQYPALSGWLRQRGNQRPSPNHTWVNLFNIKRSPQKVFHGFERCLISGIASTLWCRRFSCSPGPSAVKWSSGRRNAVKT
jgi:hypothetical protein